MAGIIGEVNATLLNAVFAFSLNMVFNMFMEDKEIILALGGPAKVAEELGLDKTKGGVQRVQNWMSRGIPAKVKIARPDLFLQHLFGAAKTKRSGKERRNGSGRRSTDKSG